MRTQWLIYLLAGHPRSGCPARLRGQRFWFVESVDSPHPSPPLPSPPLPSPPLPSPPLPSPPLPSPPSHPPSRVPNLIKLVPAVWPKLQPAEARECSAALAVSEWTRRLSAMLIIARRKMLFWKRRITRAVIRIGTNEWPIAHPTG